MTDQLVGEACARGGPTASRLLSDTELTVLPPCNHFPDIYIFSKDPAASLASMPNLPLGHAGSFRKFGARLLAELGATADSGPVSDMTTDRLDISPWLPVTPGRMQPRTA